MKHLNTIRKLIGIFVLAFLFSISIEARSAKKKKRTNIRNSIEAAMKRSNKDQDRIRDRMNNEADERVSAWKARKMEMIEIKHTGTSSIEPLDIGGAEYSDPNFGEDTSGLDTLRSNVEEESTDINFDEELREVSSMKD